MNLNEYQNFCLETKAWPSEYNIIYPAIELADEAGEVLGKVKKWMRGDDNTDTIEYKEKIIKEMGDVLYPLAMLAGDLGYSFQEVLDMNVEKLQDRRNRGVIKGSGDSR